MDNEKIKEVFSDDSFVASLMEMETAEDVQAALLEKEIDISLDEIASIRRVLSEQDDGEISDDDLEDVAGGSLTAVVCGFIIGGAVSGGLVEMGKKTHQWTNRRW